MKKILSALLFLLPLFVHAQQQKPADSASSLKQPQTKQLGVVNISARRPIIERKIDRIIFNVENSILASGGNAWEALGKAPGVQLRADNTINVNKKDVKIYLDGKPLQLSGDDLASYLQGIPSDLISRVEVFSNPPAMFDAAGSSVINIITKKSKQLGFNGTLGSAYTQSVYGSYNVSSTFNYRSSKLNVYGSYGYRDQNRAHDQQEYVIYQTADNHSFWDSPGYNKFESRSHNYRLGADYQLSEQQILGFLITGSNRSGTVLTNTPTYVTNNYKSFPDSVLQTTGHTPNRGNLYAYNLNYNIKLDTGGSSLNLDLDYSPYRSTRDQYVDNQTFFPDGTMSLSPYHIFTPTIQNIDIYSGKTEYNDQLSKTWTINSGIKYSSIRSTNIFDFYNNGGSTPQLVTGNSDHFQYTENTAAAYASVNGSVGKWTLQGGLRGELTNIRGYSQTLDSLNKRRYFKLFPTLFASYKFDDDHLLQLNYGYRIQRPEYSRLNPARHYANPYSYLTGNPALQPAFVHNIELGYTYHKDFNATAYYTVTHDVFSNVTVQDNVNKIFYDTHANVGLSASAGIRLSATFHPASWWDITFMAQGYHQQEKSDYQGGSYDYHRFSYDGTTTQSVSLYKKIGLRAEITGTYTSPVIQTIFAVDHNYAVDAGLKATVLNGQGTIRLAASDIFYSNTYRISVNYLNQNNGFYQRNDTRNGTLSFSYRFGKNIAASRKRSTSSDEEKQRAQ
ncbi:Outer membrane receptor proteins, mostly Fe transport [Pedobacter westerhofensis]|uniref:Outer membrane receptor proteins, mostly Fe transport n=1 Tax=Pedobacter westerhofensis TaxID=425512 RepID=A0A521BQ58_9SPHI|nr:outer membrane beta-barrel family protein [Pedobacter westerhofensis]SMO49277.1 Outer membrane receptor proteins, mostly Fe transport [Pedobacter westerhofensis]